MRDPFHRGAAVAEGLRPRTRHRGRLVQLGRLAASPPAAKGDAINATKTARLRRAALAYCGPDSNPSFRSATAASLPAGAAVPGVRAGIAPGCKFGQPAEVMGPAFRMAGALLGIGEAGVGQAQQGSVRRLLDQVDLDEARPRRHHLAA